MTSSSATRKGAASQQRAVPGQREEDGQVPGAGREPGKNKSPGFGFRPPGGMTGNVLWWGGLATLAALEIVDWPVAALLAAGTWIAEQHAKQSRRAGAAS